MTLVRYCLKGHWDDNDPPIYMGNPRMTQIQRQRARDRHRLETVKFCLICGSELIWACPLCNTPLRHGPDGDTPQHCGGCGKTFPWTAQAIRPVPVETTEENITAQVIPAPIGRVKAFGLRARSAVVKAAPFLGKFATKIATDVIENKLKGLSAHLCERGEHNGKAAYTISHRNDAGHERM